MPNHLICIIIMLVLALMASIIYNIILFYQKKKQKQLNLKYLDNKFNLDVLDGYEQNKISFFDKEVSHLLNQFQDAVKDGEDTGDFTEVQINTGKLKILQARLKALCKRLDPNIKGYLLSCLINSGFTNNPFVLEELDFSQAYCPEENFTGADLSHITARAINWQNVILSEARLENAKLSFANLINARLDDARLSGAYLNEANMSNAYMKGSDLQRAYLIEANMEHCYLAEAILDSAIMRKANLAGANLNNSHMFASNLSECNLQKTSFRDSFLQGATLSEANLTSAYLNGADLDGADFWRADLSHIIMIGTNFQNIYLKEAKFHGIYKDLLDCQEAELDNLQENNKYGLFASKKDLRYGVEPTNFDKCAWWLADFDADAKNTLLPYLIKNFPAPNGLVLSDEDKQIYNKLIL